MPRMAGERHAAWSWLVVGALLAAAIAQPMACNGEEEDPAGRLQTEVLAAVGAEVVRPTLDRAAIEARGLAEAAEAWASAQRSGPDPEGARALAQQAWRATMEIWQEVEVQQIGPAASSLSAPGGADLRDEIYSWPTTNRCRVDQETIRGGFSEPVFFEESLVNVYGLSALETLLFSPPGEHGCPSDADLEADGASWEALGVDGVQQARADYAAVVAGGVRDRIGELIAAWDPEGGDFGAKLASGASPFDGQSSALQSVFDALFYLELSTKDRKLGRPLGLQDCEGSACVSEAETPLAGGSERWVAANLRSFRALFLGGDGSGLDDLLASVGEEALADEILSALDRADDAASRLDVPIHLAAAEDPDDARALYDAVKEVTDRVKGDLATVLGVAVPAEGSGDND